MVKTKVEAACQSCGARMPRWVGRCPECGEFGTVVEERVGPPVVTASRAAPTQPLSAHDQSAADRFPTGIDEVDRVLGGGLVPAGVVLLAGEPGVGKSTLSLQIALSLGTSHEVLLVCGEEAPQQVKARAMRLGPIPEGVRTLADPELPAVIGAIQGSGASIVIVDSIQTIFDPEIPSAPGSVSQVRECGARLVRAARDNGVTVVLVGHVTKEGVVAGPRVLEHLVDVVLNFEGERSGGVRILRGLKNRFGSTQEAGFFQMASDGLLAIRDASAYLLADRCTGLPGSMLAACVEGRRPFVCEIQALIQSENNNPIPRRTAVGVDASRLPLLVAVLERRAGVVLGRNDVYVSAVGGIRTSEPACDLPIALAMVSSWREKALPDDAVAFGEIGLSGEIRQVVGGDRRLHEARSSGCKRAFVPHNFTSEIEGMTLHRLRHISDALALIDKQW
ncbi:MAG: DNA repair protein RadA [Actinomycetota bacterium]